MHPQEGRLANFFPELFHCSGFSLMGKAVADGHIYHGRVLDYMRGVGLEQNAVVIVHQPDIGHAWVNVSYAGFVGSVTAMNDKGISHRRDGRPRLRELGRQADGAAHPRGDGEGGYAGRGRRDHARTARARANTTT